MALKGETYRLVIKAKVDLSNDTSDSVDSGEIENIANSIVSGQSQSTNQVQNPVDGDEIPAKPTKSVTDKNGKDINKQDVKLGDEIEYHIDQKVGVLNQSISKRYTEFSITDPLPDNIAHTKAYVINKANGKTASEESDLSFDENSNTVLFTASDSFLKNMDLNGETYELVVEGKVVAKNAKTDDQDLLTDPSTDKKDSTNSSTTSASDTKQDEVTDTSDVTVIRDVATSSLNNNPQDTNEVLNYLRPETPKDEETTPGNVDSNPAESTSKMAQTGNKGFIKSILHILNLI
nr:isopeptide-forming domain-containing fimbrial protein [Companilactobacillus kedongensis]